jgi:hypothetical protein
LVADELTSSVEEIGASLLDGFVAWTGLYGEKLAKIDARLLTIGLPRHQSVFSMNVI